MLRAIAVAAALITAASAQDQAEPITSGPREGVPLPALPVYAPAGPDAGLELDLAAAIANGPGAVLFVHELTRNVAPLVRGLDRLTDSHAVLGLTSGVVIVAADRSAAERQAAAASHSLRMARPMLVSVDGLEGPGAYALNRRATLTLVLAKDGKVHRSVAFTDTGRQDLERLRALVEEVTGAVPDSPGELREVALARLPDDPDALRARAAHLALELHWRARRIAEEDEARAQREGRQQRGDRMQRDDMQRGDAMRGRAPAEDARRERRGAAPQDEQLGQLLRAAIQRDATSEAVERAFRAMAERAKASPELKQQTISMLELMLSLDYGTDAAKAKANELLRTLQGR